MTSFGPAILPLTTLLAIAASLAGLAMIWLAWGHASLLARIAPLALLLASYVPLGAYEMIALHGVQAATILIVLGVIRRWRRWCTASASTTALATETTAPSAARAQFHLRELLKWMILAALLMSIVRFAGPSTSATGTPVEWWPWLLLGVWLGLLTLLGLWLARRFPRVAFGVSGGILTLYIVGVSVALSVDIDGWEMALIGPNLLTPASVALVLSAAMPWTLYRIRSPNAGKHPVGSGTWRQRLIARSLAGGWLVFSIWALVLTYVALIPPAFPQLAPLPVPNGYDELVSAAGQLNWSAIPGQDVEAASVADCQQFAQDNTQALALMRAALSKECRSPVLFSNNLSDYSPLRDLQRAFSAESRALAQLDAKSALGSALDILRLARAVSAQGIGVDELIGYAFEGVGLRLIEDQMNALQGPELTEAARFLEGFVHAREPAEQVLARDHLWERLNYGWYIYLSNRLVREIGRDFDFHFWLCDARARNDVQIQLIIAEAAIRRHGIDTGAPPDSLESLVPKYLSRVPADPYRDGPLVYRRTEDGYLLYSVGSNGVDDGGQRVTLLEATRESIGDVFFHVPRDIPEDPSANQEPAAEEREGAPDS